MYFPLWLFFCALLHCHRQYAVNQWGVYEMQPEWLINRYSNPSLAWALIQKVVKILVYLIYVYIYCMCVNFRCHLHLQAEQLVMINPSQKTITLKEISMFSFSVFSLQQSNVSFTSMWLNCFKMFRLFQIVLFIGTLRLTCGFPLLPCTVTVWRYIQLYPGNPPLFTTTGWMIDLSQGQKDAETGPRALWDWRLSSRLEVKSRTDVSAPNCFRTKVFVIDAIWPCCYCDLVVPVYNLPQITRS